MSRSSLAPEENLKLKDLVELYLDPLVAQQKDVRKLLKMNSKLSHGMHTKKNLNKSEKKHMEGQN